MRPAGVFPYDPQVVDLAGIEGVGGGDGDGQPVGPAGGTQGAACLWPPDKVGERVGLGLSGGHRHAPPWPTELSIR